MRRPPPPSEFKRYPIVAGIWILCVMASLAWWGKIDMSPLMELPQVRRGELWRLITSTFLHVNPIHLIFNLIWWWALGTMVEAVFGHARTLLLFLVLAVGSSAAEYAFLNGGVGLSGVVYGFAAMLWVLSRRDIRFASALSQRDVTILGVWLVFCVVMTASGTMDVGNIAHFSGAILGALIGAAIVAPKPRRAVLCAVVTIIVLGVLVGATYARVYINFSHDGSAEGRLGYEALVAYRNEDAFCWLKDAVRLEPNNPADWFNYGLACGRLQRWNEAADAHERAHQLKPDDEHYAQAARSSRAAAATRHAD